MDSYKTFPIEFRNLSTAYGPHTLLQGVSVCFPESSLTALIGRNGAGKSTLLRAVAALNKHYTGTILLTGRDIRTLSAGELAKRISLVTTQRINIPNLTAREIIAMGRAPYTSWTGRLSSVDEEIIDRAMLLTDTARFADRQLNHISDGERQRIMIARAIAQDTPVILLDEPTSFLDLPARYDLAQLLQTLAHEYQKTILFSTHELDIALRYTDSIALLADHVLYNMPPAQLQSSALLQRHFNIQPSAFADNPSFAPEDNLTVPESKDP